MRAADPCPRPYDALTPDTVLDAVESLGFPVDGHLLALNSYENRVYQVGIEGDAPLVAKFYRPGRWALKAIAEEHTFAMELAAAEIPVVAPLADGRGNTVHRHGDFLFALYPRRGGRWPDLDDPDKLRWMGRMIGRIHAIGARRPFRHRPRLDAVEFGRRPRDFILEHNFLPDYLVDPYRSLVDELVGRAEEALDRVGAAAIRLHGDCHPGNILWTDDGPHFVDMDDCRSGPAVQDLWMLISGSREQMQAQLGHVVDGYGEFADFDPRQTALIEPLRTLRMIHYAGWLARRADEPAFQQAFPWFYGPRYWESHVLALREQAAALDEPPLRV